MQFVAEIPAAEGRVSLCEFHGMVVIATEFGPARIAELQPDGSYKITVIEPTTPGRMP